MSADDNMREALKLIEEAQVSLEMACQKLSPVRDLVDEWEAAGRTRDLVKALWHTVNERFIPGKLRLDSET